MKLTFLAKFRFKSMIFGFILAFTNYPAVATLNLADTPLYLSQGTEPNIMFTLDDSGSMHWELMPDNFIWSYFVYPRVAGVYGAGDYSNWVVSFDDTKLYTRAMRSPSINKTYYNPAITYQPWSKEDGSSFPDATPSAAYHNPADTSLGARNMTASNTGSAGWDDCTVLSGFSIGTNCTYTVESRTFWPAVYYSYNGSGTGTLANYTKVEIKDPSSGGASSYTGGPDRTDCASATTCTYAEEIQNFANWYTYYRSRILAARAGVGRAFSVQSTNMRVGFSAINQGSATIDGVSSSGTINAGLREFAGTDRENFFTKLYSHPIPTSGTPLRQALDDVGQYFTRTDNTGPWSKTPGTADTSDHLSCRQSYNILMSDGYWNGNAARTSAAQANVDNTTGPNITAPTTYQYAPVNPYSDAWSNTLADVGMYYWNRDLRTDLDNLVPTSSDDPAYWQHLVNFTVGLGVNGTLDPSSDLTALTNGTKSWPQPCSTCTESNIDDMWHTALNSKGDFFSTSDPDTFADSLSSTLNTIAQRTSSASAITANSTRLDTNTVIYQARFDSADWDGQLLAFELNLDGSVGNLVWDASTQIPSEATRKIYTYKSGTGGVEFLWSNLNSTQKSYLNTDINGTTDTLGSDRVDYLRGDQTNEVKNSGSFRNRNNLLGDIINSDPIYVGSTDFDYDDLPGDSGNEGINYATFRSSSPYSGRSDAIYVGSNDGMLHAFDASLGQEKFAYIPDNTIASLSKLTSPDYSHRYYVDGSLRSGDAYLTDSLGVKAWKTVLVGSMGAGGNAVFALDITDPDNFSASNVLWEYTHAELGYTLGRPTIIRMNNGDWAAVFGNGYNSTSGNAQLFIVNLSDGSLIKKIDTEVGSDNGLATVIPIDVDNDKITDYIYGGDLKGNMWKFDVTDSLTSKWEIAYKQGSTPKPLITVVDDDGNPQPITSRPDVGRHPNGGFMVFFGTGKFFEVGDNIIGSPADIQTFYAIHDDGSKITTGRSNLQEQSILAEIPAATTGFDSDVRVTSDNEVAVSKDGWYMDLVSPGDVRLGERVTTRPILRNGRIIFVTQIPSTDACTSGGDSWLMEVDAYQGSRIDGGVFDLDGDGKFTSADFANYGGDDVAVSGKKSNIGITKTPNIIDAGDVEYKVVSGSTGGIETTREDDPSDDGGRQSWKQLQ